MRASRTWGDRNGLRAVVGFRIDDRFAGFFVQTPRPGDLRERLAGDELAGDAIDHVIESVLVRLHDHFARLALDGDVGQHQLLNAVEVPFIAWDHLEVPCEFAGVGIHRKDRSGVQIFFIFALFAGVLAPGAGIPGAHIQ